MSVVTNTFSLLFGNPWGWAKPVEFETTSTRSTDLANTGTATTVTNSATGSWVESDSQIQDFFPTFPRFPDEIPLRILSFIVLEGPKTFAQKHFVSREWNRIASEKCLWQAFDLPELFPKLDIRDIKFQNTYVDFAASGLTVKEEDEPVIDKRAIIPLLFKLLASGVIEGDAGATIWTIVEGLSIDKLVELGKNRKQGKKTGISYVTAVSKSIVSKTHPVLITNKPFKVNILDCQNLIENQMILEKHGCEMPEVLAMATRNIFAAMSTLGLYAKEDSLTLCTEVLGPYKNFLVGTFVIKGNADIMLVAYENNMKVKGGVVGFHKCKTLDS